MVLLMVSWDLRPRMNSKPKKSSKKKPLDSVIMVDRRSFLSAMNMLSVIIQAMGDEFESFRSAKQSMDPEMRRTLMQLTGAHMQNVSALSAALQMSMYDPIDPDGSKGRDLN